MKSTWCEYCSKYDDCEVNYCPDHYIEVCPFCRKCIYKETCKEECQYEDQSK